MTLFFSHATSNLATVILAMNEIEKELTIWGHNFVNVGAPIHAAIRITKCTLNWYYELTDMSEVYQIAMSKSWNTLYVFVRLINYHTIVLHPYHKLSYFKTAGWEQDWIDTTKDLLWKEYEQPYKEVLIVNGSGSEYGKDPEVFQLASKVHYTPHQVKYH